MWDGGSLPYLRRIKLEIGRDRAFVKYVRVTDIILGKKKYYDIIREQEAFNLKIMTIWQGG